MRRILRARLLASALVISIVPFVAAAIPAQAQYRSDASFDSFHDQLARYGDWVYSDRWGLVWQPADVPDDFRPYYSGGRWAYTGEYGWTWASDYDWGDIAFHYGRWVDDPTDGWMWIPGYTWSPGWVIWRSNSHSVGWMAMPPDNQFLGSRNNNYFEMSFGGVSLNWNDTSGYYGYSRWYGRDYDQRRFAANWTFVDTGHMADRDYRHVAYAPDRAITSIRQTTNITNYKVINNYMVNSSVDAHTVERASGRPVVAVAPTAVFKHPNSVMTIDAGQKARAREFDRAPHGTGLANSAPPPPPTVIDKLSDHQAAHHAGAMPGVAGALNAGSKGAPHLFTKTTITAPTAASQFHGNLRPGAIGAPPASTPLPPTGAQGLHPVPTVATPVAPKPVPGTVTGPGPVGAQAHPFEHKPLPVVTGPATQPVVKPPEHKLVAPVTEPVAKPIIAPVVKPLEHKLVPPVTEPVAKPVIAPVVKPPEHRMMPPAAEPVAKPMERSAQPPVVSPVTTPKPAVPAVLPPPAVHTPPPAVHTPPPVVHTPPPVVHTPPPAVKSAPPPAKPDPKKDDRKNKNEQDKPN